MYTPAAFAVTDIETLHQTMRQYSFATLVSSGPGPMEVTHLPLHLDSTAGPRGTLTGHFARANPQSRSAIDAPAVAIFHGPHAYISPTWYEEPNLVPTWNYVAVHARGVPRLIEDRDRLRELVRTMVADYESDRPQPWRMETLDGAVQERLLGAIVGFEMVIESLEGKWKLSQNHPVERRRRVIAALAQSSAVEDQLVSQLMVDTLPSD